MVQPPGAGAANIHTRPAPNRFQPFKYLDFLGTVSGIIFQQ
jgi:hypothetical protein